MSKPEPDNYKKISKEMGEFYLALGAFNANMVARVINKPDSVREVMNRITVIACPDHDVQCQPGWMWNHQSESCMQKPIVDQDG
jgi:hypothetical protein